MSTKYSSNSISEDFPLYHSKNIPIYSPIKANNRHHKNITNLRIMVTNEHPDIFRIKGIKEGGYVNPFLKEVLKVDREEYYKKINDMSKKIKLIDLIKSSRKYSQDPKYLSLINNDDYFKKTKINFSSSDNLTLRNKFSVSLENNENLLNSALRTLNIKREKITRNNTKKNIDFNKMKKIGDNYIINQDDLNKIKTINCDFNTDKSAFMSNCSNYKLIKTFDESDFKDKSFLYPRKPLHIFNPINNSTTSLDLPPYIFPKWSNIAENYFALNQTKNGFRKKGGLFSQFVDKNSDKIKILNNDLKKKLKYLNENEKRRNFTERKKLELDTKKNSFIVTKFSGKKNALLDRLKKLSMKNRSCVNFF